MSSGTEATMSALRVARAATGRDLVVIACCLLREHSSLKAFWYLLANYNRVLEKRRAIMQRRRADDEYIASWFRYTPTSRPASKPPARVLARSKAAQG